MFSFVNHPAFAQADLAYSAMSPRLATPVIERKRQGTEGKVGGLWVGLNSGCTFEAQPKTEVRL